MIYSERNRRLSVAVVAVLSAACVTVVIATVATQLWAARERIERVGIQAAHHLGHSSAAYAERVIEGVDAVLAALADEMSASPALGIDQIRDRAYPTVTHLTTLLLVERDGTISLRDRNLPAGPRLPDGVLLPAIPGEPAVSCIFADGEGYMLVVRRRFDARGEFTGFIAGAIALSQFRALLLNNEEPSLAGIYGRDGSRCAPADEDAGDLPLVRPAAAHHDADHGWDVEGAVVSHEIGRSGMTVVSFVDWDEAFEPWRRDALPATILAGVLVLILTAGTTFLIRVLNRSFAHHNTRIGDITEINALLKDLAASSRAAHEDSEGRFQTVFTHAGIGIAVLAPDGRLMDINPRFRAIVGEPPANASFADLLHPDDRARLGEVLERLGGGSLDHISIDLRSPGTPPRWMEVTLTAQRRNGTTPPLIIAMSLDITGRKLAEIDMENARHSAEKASDAKSRFLAAAAHDLRQPLQALTMFVDELSYHTLPAPCREVVAKVDSSTRALSTLLNGLLDIGAIDSGMTVPQLAEVPVARVLEAVESRFCPLAEAKGLELRVVPSEAAVLSDPLLLIRILSNFVSNAIRYTERGRILVGCRRNADRLRVMVADTGMGIPEDQLPLIFEEYYQIDNAGRDRRRGTGLGLAIVHRLAALLGHPVEARSVVGRGSAFAISLPLLNGSRPAETPASPRPSADGGGALVMVVDDDPEVRNAIERALTNRNYAVLPAASGQEARELARWAGRPPAIIIADYRLTAHENGAQVIESVRACYPDTEIAAVILTGEQRLDKVPDGVLVLRKPIAPSQLCALLQRQDRPHASSKSAMR